MTRSWIGSFIAEDRTSNRERPNMCWTDIKGEGHRKSQEQRHFLKIFFQTTSTQRKALLQTITKRQHTALSQIVHNITKFRIKLSPSEKALLKRERRLLYILGDRTMGYFRKSEILRGKQRFVYTLLKIAFTCLEPLLR